MRKVEAQMIQAIRDKRNWRGGNTEVRQDNDGARVWLHGNLIARVWPNGVCSPMPSTFREYPTRTTASRLRALGINATIKGGEPHINGIPL